MSQIKVETTRFVTLSAYAANQTVKGRVVTVLASRHEARGLRLIATYSRAVQKYSIHELIVTDEKDKQPGDKVDHVAYLAFFEIIHGGCIVVGETLRFGKRDIGTVIGFDETHEPNHINIIIGVGQRHTGSELNLSIGEDIFLSSHKSAV